MPQTHKKDWGLQDDRVRGHTSEQINPADPPKSHRVECVRDRRPWTALCALRIILLLMNRIAFAHTHPEQHHDQARRSCGNPCKHEVRCAPTGRTDQAFCKWGVHKNPGTGGSMRQGHRLLEETLEPATDQHGHRNRGKSSDSKSNEPPLRNHEQQPRLPNRIQGQTDGHNDQTGRVHPLRAIAVNEPPDNGTGEAINDQ